MSGTVRRRRRKRAIKSTVEQLAIADELSPDMTRSDLIFMLENLPYRCPNFGAVLVSIHREVRDYLLRRLRTEKRVCAVRT